MVLGPGVSPGAPVGGREHVTNKIILRFGPLRRFDTACPFSKERLVNLRTAKEKFDKAGPSHAALTRSHLSWDLTKTPDGV